MTAALLPAALVAYLVGVVLAVAGTVNRSDSTRGGATALATVGWVAHTGALALRSVERGEIPLANVAEYLVVFAWAVAALHLLVVFSLKIHVSGLVLLPAAVGAGLAGLALRPSEGGGAADPHGAWFFFHTAVSTLGMATLTLSLAMSLVFLFQDRALKTRSGLGLLERLPSLERCDQLAFQALVAGFVLLSVGIATGVVVNTDVHSRWWRFELKQMLPLAAWAVFALVLASRLLFGLRGRKSAWITVAGVALGLATATGMTL